MASLSALKSPSVYYITVSEDFVGQRLDNFLTTHLKGLPKTRIYRIIRKGEVRVNKGRVKPDYRLNPGDVIRIPPVRTAEETPLNHVPEKVNQLLLSQILYEDDGLIVLNKPSGMAVHGGSGLSFGVIEALRILRPDVRSLELVHRLDRDTSGCLMVAKKRSILRILHAALREGQLGKVYWTLVKGPWKGGKRIDAPLQKNQLSSGERIVRVNQAQGQSAYTEFKVLQNYPQATLLEARPLTGRTHQIRVHATHAGSPIAGDPKYGDEEFNRQMKKIGLNRLFLHAKSICISLPDHTEPLTIEAPLVCPLTDVLDNLSGGNDHV
jgi:23S rRNA pseudouridine955/2504/2580 synthase